VSTGAGARRRKVAGGFRWDAKLENLIAMREARPEAYDRLSGQLHMQVGYYENAKAAAQAEGIDTDPPEAA
jgi:hypothetical protein